MDNSSKHARYNDDDVDMVAGGADQPQSLENAEDFEIDISEAKREVALQKIVLPGDYIGEGFIAGHGTYESKPKGSDQEPLIYASMAGVVHQIDRVICVRPLRQGYRPDVGDVIVGRVVQVDQKRWMIDVNSYQHGHLNLSSINKPGGIQRRVNEEDQLNMRSHFREGDMISAEVQQVNSNDGKISLHTRNQKYGKLINGFLLKADSNFVRRMKNHMVDLQVGSQTISCIIGTNGYIWIHSGQSTGKNQASQISVDNRQAMAIVRNAMINLQECQLPIFKDTVDRVVAQFYIAKQKDSKLSAKSMLEDVDLKSELTKTAQAFIQKEINTQQKQFDMDKVLEQMNDKQFIELGRQVD